MYLKCELCGKLFKHLGTHVWGGHNMLAIDYKIRFGFDRKHPLCSDYISEKHRKDSIKFELCKKGDKFGKPFLFVKGDKRFFYKRSEETKRVLSKRCYDMVKASYLTEEARRKTSRILSRARMGIKLKQESIEKIRKAAKLRWSNKLWRSNRMKQISRNVKRDRGQNG